VNEQDTLEEGTEINMYNDFSENVVEGIWKNKSQNISIFPVLSVCCLLVSDSRKTRLLTGLGDGATKN
jgi:hypothetical protein